MANNAKDRRGLASADQKTKERVAKMGGQAFHEKRGAKGSDTRGDDRANPRSGQ